MARLDVLFTGYVGDRVAGTISLVRAPGFVAVVDPGMVPERRAIVGPLHGFGVEPEEVTDVVLSHHHPDHTMNTALFTHARVHDHWAVYDRDVWHSRPAEDAVLAPGVRLIETPGHSREDITTLVDTDEGVVACTHLWWHAQMTGDPLAWDLDRLHDGRARVCDLADVVVPGHGAPFAVDEDTPR